MLIHIGYPKTGSTWLQNNLVGAAHTGLMAVAKRRMVKELLIRANPLWYEPDRLFDHVGPRLEMCRRRSRVPVISHELLAGHPLSAGHNSTLIADRLKTAFPDARVLIVIREQRAMLLSLYKEYVKNGGPGPLHRYWHPPGGERYPVFDFRYLEFHRLIGYYHDLYGPDRVCVLPFEWFVEDKLAFCNTILRFAGAEPTARVPEERRRPSLGGLAVAIRARTNALLHRDGNNAEARFYLPAVAKLIEGLDRNLPAAWGRFFDRRMVSEIEAKVGHRYTDSNERTADLIGLDLARYGYCTRSESRTEPPAG